MQRPFFLSPRLSAGDRGCWSLSPTNTPDAALTSIIQNFGITGPCSSVNPPLITEAIVACAEHANAMDSGGLMQRGGRQQKPLLSAIVQAACEICGSSLEPRAPAEQSVALMESLMMSRTAREV